nr:efflux RND transporter periplasmic adaptor subunit [Polymorphobacter sp.]
MTRLTPSAAGTALLALLAACSSAPDAAEKPADPVATVRTAVATSGSAARTVALYGVAEAGAGAERALAIEVEARLARIAAPSGTAVHAGQVIAVLTPTPTSRLEAAKAASDASVANLALARAQRLRADGLMSNAEVETARAAATAASATRSAVGARAASLTIRAPADGTVQALTARPGDIVAAGVAVATIATKGEARARFGIDPVLAAQVRAGQPLQITRPSGGAPIAAIVAGVDPQVDPTTRLASVFARFAPGSRVSPGEALGAMLPVGGGVTSGVVLPYAALLDDGGRSYVFVVKNGVAQSRNVVPGNSAGDSISIASGIAPGERVVVAGGTAIDDGMKVRDAGK